MTKPTQINFTVPTLDNLPVPLKGVVTYKDLRQPSLSIYVTSNGIKTFFVRKRVKGRDERLKIGRFPDVKIEQARAKAAVFSGIIAERKDPLEELKKERLNSLTFGEHFRDYMERYSKLHKRSWKYDEDQINRYVSHWFKKKLSDISKDDVTRLHEKIGKENGKVQANSIVRRLSSIFNKASYWGWEGNNPAKGIHQFKEKSRDRFIFPSEMPYLMQAVYQEESDMLKDYILLLLFTGVRKTNLLTMKWEQINWEMNEWRIPDTKNGEPLHLPIVPQAMDILRSRRQGANSIWVFPQEDDPKKHLIDPQKAWKRAISRATLLIWNQDKTLTEWLLGKEKNMLSYLSSANKVERLKKMAFSENILLPNDLMDVRIHDIRRTFGSYQALRGASLQIIGKSLGHKSTKTTQIYSRLQLDPIRAAMEKAVDVMIERITV